MMTPLDQQQIKGITVKNVVVTVISAASIVASVMTTYFGLKDDILEIKTSQTAETNINNMRLKILEDQVARLQKQVDNMKQRDKETWAVTKNIVPLKSAVPVLLIPAIPLSDNQ